MVGNRITSRILSELVSIITCTVDAHAHAARGRHTVFHGGEEILVQHFGLVIAPLPLLHLLFKALALVDGVVQLGIGVGQLAVADKQLEALRQPGIGGAALGQRG